jgi:hypothetical protein
MQLCLGQGSWFDAKSTEGQHISSMIKDITFHACLMHEKTP